jgi:hypothetical protein
MHTFRGSFYFLLKYLVWNIRSLLQILVLSSNTKKGEIESAYFISLMFCVLDKNIRNFKCVLSGADFTAQRLAKSLEWHLTVLGQIIRLGAG